MPLNKRSDMFITLIIGFILTTIFFVTPGICDSTSNTSVSEIRRPVGVVTASKVNIRKEPSIRSEISGKIAYKGTIVRIFGYKLGWYKIHFQSNEGWINSDFITRCEGKGVIGEAPVDVREGPGMEYAVIREIPHTGTIVEPILSTDLWYKVRANDFEGWVNKKSILLCDEQIDISAEEPVKTDREKPGTDSTASHPKQKDTQQGQAVVIDKLNEVGSSKDVEVVKAQKEQDVNTEHRTEATLAQSQSKRTLNFNLGLGYSYINETIQNSYQGNSTDFSVARSVYPVLRVSYFITWISPVVRGRFAN